MSPDARNENVSPADAYRNEVREYLAGFAWAVVLTAVPFSMVWAGGYTVTGTVAVIAILGIFQAGIHVRYFLHVDGSVSHREERHLLLFSILLLILMAAGTVWVVINMNMRMMGA